MFYHEMQTDMLRLKGQDEPRSFKHVVHDQQEIRQNGAMFESRGWCEEVCFIGLLFLMLEIFIKKEKLSR